MGIVKMIGQRKIAICAGILTLSRCFEHFISRQPKAILVMLVPEWKLIGVRVPREMRPWYGCIHASKAIVGSYAVQGLCDIEALAYVEVGAVEYDLIEPASIDVTCGCWS